MIGHFTALLHNARELCPLDYRGEIVPREQQTKFCSEIPIRCITDDKTIEVGFLLGFEAELSRMQKLEEAQRLPAIAYAGAKETIPRFAQFGPWKLYDFILMPVSGSGPIRPATDVHELKQDEKLSPAVTEELTKATARHRDTAVAFERAKNFLNPIFNTYENIHPKQRVPRVS